MATTFVQFRLEETVKIKAAEICEKLGIDLPTYFRMCATRLVQDSGIPFSMKIEQKTPNKGLAAMKAASMIAEQNGIANMSLEEINEEINAARGIE